MPYQREPQVVLAIGRDVERDLESTEPGSPEAEFLQTEVARLRNDHKQLVAQARQKGLPEPPPLPEPLHRSVS